MLAQHVQSPRLTLMCCRGGKIVVDENQATNVTCMTDLNSWASTSSHCALVEEHLLRTGTLAVGVRV